MVFIEAVKNTSEQLNAARRQGADTSQTKRRFCLPRRDFQKMLGQLDLRRKKPFRGKQLIPESQLL
jgi:hypothetical protein